jgi:hypothetical protein
MSTLFFVLMLLAMLAVLVSLGVGMYYMTRQGEAYRHKSNQWMQYRVMLQGLAILLFALAALTSGHH